MSKFIHVITDYGSGDPAFGEVIQRIAYQVPDSQIYPTSVDAFDTLATGYWIYQFGMGPHPEPMYIYANTAPRKDNKAAREHNEGEGFMYAKLTNGVEVMAVNAGFCFSFIKPHIESLRIADVANKGSQFRSRDFYPEGLGKLIRGEAVLLDTVDVSHIPDPPTQQVAWVDGYGNLKTTIRKSHIHFTAGDKVRISINNVVRTALVAGGNFSVAEGELSFSPGSSGYEDPFMELFLRGGSAYNLFNQPHTQSEIEFI